VARTAGETTSLNILKEIRKLYIEDQESSPNISKILRKKYPNVEGLGKSNIDTIIQRLKKTDIQGVKKFTALELRNRPLRGKLNVTDNPKLRKIIFEDAKNLSRRELIAGKGRIPVTHQQVDNLYNKYGLRFGKVEKGKAPIKTNVTTDGNKILKVLQNNPNVKAADILKDANITKKEYDSAMRALKNNTLVDGKMRFNISPELQKIITKLPIGIPQSFEEQALKKGIPKEKIAVGMTRPRAALREFFTKGSVFEHTFPKSLLPFLKNKKLEEQLFLTGERTSPFLNSFKSKYDNLQRGLVNRFLNNEISLTEYNKEIAKVRNTVKNATGGYETGYIKFDKNKKPTPIVKASEVSESFKEFGPGTYQKTTAFKNAKYSSNLLKKYLKDPNNPMFDRIKDQFPPESIDQDIIKQLDKAAIDYNKAKGSVGSLKKFTDFAKKNLNNSFVKALFKTPYGKSALVAGAVLSPTALMADEPGKVIEENPELIAGGAAAGLATGLGIKYNKEIGAFVTGNEDNIASQADLKKYAADNPMEVKVGEEPLKAATNKSVLANVGKAMARVGAPLPTAIIDSYFIGQQVKEGKGTAEIASNPLNWLGLATMEPLTKISGVAEGGGLNKALRLGLNPATIRGITRFAGLPGLAISTAMTAYDQYQKYKDGEGFIFNLLNQKGTE
jgi:hypothetical protein